MDDKNHIFSFPGGDILAGIAAWWFVSYSYYLYIDRAHFNWQKVGTVSQRMGKYHASKKYHVYWLTEVLDMKNLDVHKNKGGLTSHQIKCMARELLSRLSKDGGISEIEALLEDTKAELERKRREKAYT